MCIYEGCHMDEIWVDSIATQVGPIVDENDVDNIVSIIEKTYVEFSAEKLSRLRDKHFANVGHSGKAIADYIIRETNELCMSPKERKLDAEVKRLKKELTELKKRTEAHS